MNYFKIHYLLLFVLLASCKEHKKINPDFTSRPEIIDISKSQFNGNPIILNQNEIIELYGNPTFEKKDCVIFSDLITDLKEFKYDCWIYDSISRFGFDVFDKIGYLSYVSFDNNNINIKTPQINLNSKTNIQEIKKIFPKSYNLKVTDGTIGIILLSLNDNLMDESKEFANIIELGFEKENLKYFKYQIEPEYMPELNK